MIVVIILCLALLMVAASLALFRLMVGPTLLDRIIGFDMGAICIVGMIILLSIHWQTRVFIEIMLIFSLLGFVGTVAFVAYLYGNPDRLRHRSELEGIRKEEENGDA